MTTKRTKQLQTKRDDTANVIAELFKITPDYVRQVMRDTNHTKYKGENPMAIRKAFLKYKNGKLRLFKQITKQQLAA